MNFVFLFHVCTTYQVPAYPILSKDHRKKTDWAVASVQLLSCFYGFLNWFSCVIAYIITILYFLSQVEVYNKILQWFFSKVHILKHVYFDKQKVQRLKPL